MKPNAKKNAKKTAARRRPGRGHRDLERFPTEFGPPRGRANFYGHFSPARRAKLRRFAGRLAAAEGEDEKRSLLARAPVWLRKLLGGAR